MESAPGAQRVKLLAAGAGDFLLTATLYHLQALAEHRQLPVRASAVLHRRSPLAGVVASDSTATEPADLAGLRLGAPVDAQIGWLAAELQAVLHERQIAPVEIIDMTYPDAYRAIGGGDVDLVANFGDLLPIDEMRSGLSLRAIPLEPHVYTSSLLASSSLDDDLVGRMVSATAASFERQRHDPSRGVDALRTRYPEVDPGVAVATWRRLEPYVFAEAGVGGMDDAGWDRTITWARKVHRLGPDVGVEEVLRPWR